MANEWQQGDICYIAGSTKAKMISKTMKNGLPHYKVQVVGPCGKDSKYKPGDEAILMRSFIHKTQHRRPVFA